MPQHFNVVTPLCGSAAINIDDRNIARLGLGYAPEGFLLSPWHCRDLKDAKVLLEETA